MFLQSLQLAMAVSSFCANNGETFPGYDTLLKVGYAIIYSFSIAANLPKKLAVTLFFYHYCSLFYVMLMLKKLRKDQFCIQQQWTSGGIFCQTFTITCVICDVMRNKNMPCMSNICKKKQDFWKQYFVFMNLYGRIYNTN